MAKGRESVSSWDREGIREQKWGLSPFLSLGEEVSRRGAESAEINAKNARN